MQENKKGQVIKKVIFTLLLAITLSLFLPTHNVTKAAPTLELTYPNFANAPTGGPQAEFPSIEHYILYVFEFLIAIAGIIGLISLVIAGIRILASGGNPAVINNAKETLIQVLLGLLLLLFSFIILKTINPELVSPQSSITNLPDGIYLARENPDGVTPDHPDGMIYTPAPKFWDDLQIGYNDYTEFYYKCTPQQGVTENLLFLAYSNPDARVNYQTNGAPNMTTYVIPCGSDTNNHLAIKALGIRSYITSDESSGVYYYLKDNCQGITACRDFRSECSQSISGLIPDFDNQITGDHSIRSIKIVNHSDAFQYALILNTAHDLENGECSTPIIAPTLASGGNNENFCISIGSGAWPTMLNNQKFEPQPNTYAAILDQSLYPPYEVDQGVSFRSPNLYASFDQAGPDVNRNIGEKLVLSGNLDEYIKNQGSQWREPPNPNIPPNECTPTDSTIQQYSQNYKGYRSCIDQITMAGDYVVILYTKNETDNDVTCQIFSNEVDFNQSHPYSLNRDQLIYQTIIMPVLPY